MDDSEYVIGIGILFATPLMIPILIGYSPAELFDSMKDILMYPFKILFGL